MAGAAITLAPAAHAGAPGGTQASDRNTDFNGDGYEDALSAAPGATVSGQRGAGYATVQYGSSRGIGTTHKSVVSQSTTGVPGAAEAGDRFGAALASGDLDSDGYDDAIVGIPGEDIGDAADAGGVVVLWGSSTGLDGADSTWLESAEPTAKQTFGAALAAARFTGDTDGDLLAVLDRDDLELYGYQATALRRTGAAKGLEKSALADDGPRDILPTALTTGDYDANGFADLVVSGTTTGDEPGHGWSTVLTGQSDGLYYQRDLRGGPSVASGDINDDGFDDLVTGEPHSPDDAGETLTGGVVGVYYGSPEGPSGADGVGTPPRWWTQDTEGVPGVAEKGDGWGADLSLGDTDGDGYADLAVGAPGEDIGTASDAGAVWLLRGSADGLTVKGARDFNQNSPDVPGDAENSDRFGSQVRLIDPNKDGKFGLLASAPGENTADGVVWVFSAGAGGLTASGSWTYGGGSLGAPSAKANFGAVIDE